MRKQRLLTTILVLPITLGTVLVAEGLLNYLGPQGWLNRTLMTLRLDRDADEARAQLLGRVPVADYHRLSIHVPADAVLRDRHRPVAGAGGIDARREGSSQHSGTSSCRCWYPASLSPSASAFVQAFSVFPSAVLLGAPAGPTRVISIAAYEAAFEQYDYSLASAIAMIMALVQLVIVVAVLSLRTLFYRGPASGGKG